MDIGEIQDVTDSLALMADPALQQYAQMHKDDPYIVSLAMSENNRRKKMRAAQQGQAGQMPPPKVVDQAIQSINPPPPQPQPMPQQGMPQQPPMPQQGMPQAQQQLPEDQGIAQLPAPNMQGMADGGIVGYSVGGVPEGAIIIGNMYKDPTTGVMKPLPESDAMPFGNVQRKPQAVQNSLFDKYMEMFMSDEGVKNRQKQRLKEVDKTYQNSPEAVATPTVSTVKPAVLAPSNAGQGQGQRGKPAPAPVNDMVLVERLAAKPKTEAGIQSLVNTGADAGMGINQAGAPTSDPAAMAAEYAKIRDAYTPVNRFGKEIGELTAAERTMLEQEKTQALADIEKRGPAMAGYEKRLKGKEERLAKQEADLSGMSFVEAGLAIMAGASPNALSNIGAGAQVGVKAYKAGLDKLSEARDKLDESFARIEELRRSEGMANDKDIRQMNKGIAQTFVKAKDMGLNALMEDGKLGRKEAETAFTALAANRRSIWEQGQQTQRTATQERGANARAAMLPGEARMLMQLGGGDLKKGMKIQQSIGATEFNPIASYADYLKGFAGKETITPPMSFADYVAQFQGPKVVNVTPANLKP
jgi:hypothetical protein